MEELNNPKQFRLAILYNIVQAMEDSGKIQLQKTLYFLQEAFGVPSMYSFRMHHYGPYSEELETDLSRLKSTGYLCVRPDAQGYGFHVTVLDPPEDTWSQMINAYKGQIEQVLTLVQHRESSELELMATLHFVNQISDNPTADQLINAVHSLKPKFSRDYILGFRKELTKAGLL